MRRESQTGRYDERDINRRRIFWTKSRAFVKSTEITWWGWIRSPVFLRGITVVSAARAAQQKVKLPYLQTMRRNERQGAIYSSLKNTSAAWSQDRFRFSCKNVICYSFLSPSTCQHFVQFLSSNCSYRKMHAYLKHYFKTSNMVKTILLIVN